MITAVCLVALSVAFLVALWLQQEGHREAQAQWALERRELLNRIQKPEVLPMPSFGQFSAPEQPADEFNLVGTIRNDPELYLKADDPES